MSEEDLEGCTLHKTRPQNKQIDDVINMNK